MNKARKNIIIVGFDKQECNSIGLPYIEKSVTHYVNSISEAIKYQGYLLIINNEDNINIVDLDKKYRKSFNKYERVLIYNPSYKYRRDKWSRIEKVNRNIFEDISYSILEEWEEYKKTKETTKIQEFSIDKIKKLNILYNYIKSFKTIKTDKVIIDLNINIRTIERYMNELNSIYHNIGYDYSQNEWYFIW